MSAESETNAAPEAGAAAINTVKGMRKNGQFVPSFELHDTDNHLFTGKQWHQTKTAFRPRTNQTSFARRQEEKKALDAVKAKEKEMKDEKQAEKQVCLDNALQNSTLTNL